MEIPLQKSQKTTSFLTDIYHLCQKSKIFRFSVCVNFGYMLFGIIINIIGWNGGLQWLDGLLAEKSADYNQYIWAGFDFSILLKSAHNLLNDIPVLFNDLHYFVRYRLLPFNSIMFIPFLPFGFNVGYWLYSILTFFLSLYLTWRIYQFLNKKKLDTVRNIRILGLIVLFNPICFSNYMLGQTTLISALFLWLVYENFSQKEHALKSGIYFALAVMIKPIALALLPILLPIQMIDKTFHINWGKVIKYLIGIICIGILLWLFFPIALICLPIVLLIILIIQLLKRFHIDWEKLIKFLMGLIILVTLLFVFFIMNPGTFEKYMDVNDDPEDIDLSLSLTYYIWLILSKVNIFIDPNYLFLIGITVSTIWIMKERYFKESSFEFCYMIAFFNSMLFFTTSWSIYQIILDPFVLIFLLNLEQKSKLSKKEFDSCVIIMILMQFMEVFHIIHELVRIVPILYLFFYIFCYIKNNQIEIIKNEPLIIKK